MDRFIVTIDRDYRLVQVVDSQTTLILASWPEGERFAREQAERYATRMNESVKYQSPGLAR